MKILALTNLYPPDVVGGYEIACSQAVQGLAERGHAVRVLTSAPRQPVPRECLISRTLQLADVWSTYLNSFEHSTSPTLHRLNAASRLINAHNVHALINELETFPPDVVYLHNLIGLGGMGLVACLQYLKVPWVWQLGDRVPQYLCCRWEHVHPALAREFERLGEGHYIVVSNRLLDEIAAHGVTLRCEVEVLPNGITGARPPARTNFYAGGTLRIVSSGQMIKNKGMDIVIESAARLRELGHEDFTVDLYGRVTDPYFPNAVRQLDLAHHVQLKGPRTQAELQTLYRDYDLFAFPTWEREPFGLGPIEAGSAGCVSIITRACGIAEWLVDGVHLLKAPRTAEAFAQVYRKVASGEISLEPIGRRVQSVVWRDFHLDAILPRIESVLERAARRPRRGAGSTAQAYRLALLAEKLAHVLIEEPMCA